MKTTCNFITKIAPKMCISGFYGTVVVKLKKWFRKLVEIYTCDVYGNTEYHSHVIIGSDYAFSM